MSFTWYLALLKSGLSNSIHLETSAETCILAKLNEQYFLLLHMCSTEAGICSCTRQTTHSPERKERNTPMKPSAPFMSEKMNKGAFSPTDDHVQ